LGTIINKFRRQSPSLPVTVRLAPDVLEKVYHAGRYARIEHAEPAGADGWIKLRLLFETEESACGYLLSFGTQVEILEPLALREKVIQLAESVVTFYNNLTSQTYQSETPGYSAAKSDSHADRPPEQPYRQEP
jgi:predicted DNA-binding transcriptional regulator YafY